MSFDICILIWNFLHCLPSEFYFLIFTIFHDFIKINKLKIICLKNNLTIVRVVQNLKGLALH